MTYKIKNLKLASFGLKLIDWAFQRMPVLRILVKDLTQRRPLKNYKIGACLHVTSETANLIRVLKAAGAQIFLCASNPLSTKDEVAAALVKYFKIPVFAFFGEDKKNYFNFINQVLSFKPNLLIDDGADLITTAIKKKIKGIIGASEETTTGVIRIKNLAKEKKLSFPVIAVNQAQTKYLFDNRYGTGQSTIDGLLRATNLLLAGKKVVVCGYGWCGKGLSQRAKGLGAEVIVCEVNPLKALEAKMDGFEVLSLNQAAEIGDIFLTVTGNLNVIRKEHFFKMKDGVILANAGHFNVEINLKDLEKITQTKKEIRPFIEEYTLTNKKKIYLLAQGRLLNLVAAEGHPAEVMDLSFAGQALAQEFLVKNAKSLERKLYSLPEELDQKIAKLKLKSLGVTIDQLTKEQERYLKSWQ
ncbi:MAG: adenosylhomocysteinase [Patescibacteria group bacterium]|nr:adenosylhomocysteinase [Patescibacteria group bacterium]